MALTSNVLLRDLSLVEPLGAAVVAPAITAAPAPAYVPLGFAPIPSNPILAPPPDGQFMGKGGTSFGSAPDVYLRPLNGGAFESTLYIVPPASLYDAPNPVEAPAGNLTPARPGEMSIVPLPRVPPPVKPTIAPAIPAATPPGPIAGKLAGVDLAMVPLWAWLAGAALLGAKFLK